MIQSINQIVEIAYQTGGILALAILAIIAAAFVVLCSLIIKYSLTSKSANHE